MASLYPAGRLTGGCPRSWRFPIIRGSSGYSFIRSSNRGRFRRIRFFHRSSPPPSIRAGSFENGMTPHPNPVVRVGSVQIGNALPLALIAGPCQLESRQHALEMASALKEIAARAGVGLVYKTSFDKANRTSAGGKRGLGFKGSLPIFAEIRESLGVPVL